MVGITRMFIGIWISVLAGCKGHLVQSAFFSTAQLCFSWSPQFRQVFQSRVPVATTELINPKDRFPFIVRPLCTHSLWAGVTCLLWSWCGQGLPCILLTKRGQGPFSKGKAGCCDPKGKKCLKENHCWYPSKAMGRSESLPEVRYIKH